MTDASPILAVFDQNRKENKWLDRLLDLKNINGKMTIEAEPDSMTIPYAFLTSDTFDVGAKGIFGASGRQGVFYAKTGKLAGILAIDNKNKKFSVIDATGSSRPTRPAGRCRASTIRPRSKSRATPASAPPPRGEAEEAAVLAVQEAPAVAGRRARRAALAPRPGSSHKQAAVTFEPAPNEPGQTPINPLLKFALELGPLAVFFFANARGEWLAEKIPPLGALGGPLFVGTALFVVATVVSLVVSLALTRPFADHAAGQRHRRAHLRRPGAVAARRPLHQDEADDHQRACSAARCSGGCFSASPRSATSSIPRSG